MANNHNIYSSSPKSSPSVGGSGSPGTADSSFALSTPPRPSFDFPRRVQASKPRPKSVQKEQQRHLASSHSLTGVRYPATEDFDLVWKSPPSEEVAQTLLDHIIEKYGLLPKNSVAKAFNRGDFNILFMIESPDEKIGCVPEDADGLPRLILRLGLPLDPYYKMENEVSVMYFARVKAGLPVPRVFWFDSSAKNPVHLEWMLMEYMEGKSLADYDWHERDPNVADLSHSIMRHLDRLAEHRFDQIGSLYCDWETREFFLGPCTEYDFVRGPRVLYRDISRGPFQSLEEYFGSLIEYHVRDAENTRILDRSLGFDTSSSCSQRDNAAGEGLCTCVIHVRESYRKMAIRIRDRLIPPLLKRVRKMNEKDGLIGPLCGYTSLLSHSDLHPHNLLVTEEESASSPALSIKTISAFIDWESQMAIPRCLLRPVPKLVLYLPFPREDRAHYPNGELEGPSLAQLLDGNARYVDIFGSPFMPPPESTAPQAVALFAFQSRLERLFVMDEERLEWFDEAIALFDDSSRPEDAKSDGDDGDSDDGARGGEGVGSEKDEQDHDSINLSSFAGSHKQLDHGNPSGTSSSGNGSHADGYSKWKGPGSEQSLKSLEEVHRASSFSPPTSSAERTFDPQSFPGQLAPLRAACQNSPQPFDVPDLEDVDLGVPGVQHFPLRPSPEVENVASRPFPGFNVQLLPYSSPGPMKVPLKDLMNGFTSRDIYRWNRNGGVPSANVDADDAVHNDLQSTRQNIPITATILRAWCCS